MAKKKEPSLADSLNNFKDTMLRASLSDYVYVNKNLITVHPKGYSVIVIPDQDLWTTIIDDEEMKKDITEANLNNPDDSELADLIKYCNDLDSPLWIELDPEVLYKGKIIRVKVHDNFEYDIPINRDLLPLKLKKAEYNNISYRIFMDDESPVLCIRKKFEYPLENGGFAMIRVFSII